MTPINRLSYQRGTEKKGSHEQFLCSRAKQLGAKRETKHLRQMGWHGAYSLEAGRLGLGGPAPEEGRLAEHLVEREDDGHG